MEKPAQFRVKTNMAHCDAVGQHLQELFPFAALERPCAQIRWYVVLGPLLAVEDKVAKAIIENVELAVPGEHRRWLHSFRTQLEAHLGREWFGQMTIEAEDFRARRQDQIASPAGALREMRFPVGKRADLRKASRRRENVCSTTSRVRMMV